MTEMLGLGEEACILAFFCSTVKIQFKLIWIFSLLMFQADVIQAEFDTAGL